MRLFQGSISQVDHVAVQQPMSEVSRLVPYQSICVLVIGS